MPLRSGELRESIEIQSPTKEQLLDGSKEKKWTTHIKVFAKIETLIGKEVQWAAQNHANVSHKVTIRFHNNINSTMRIKYKERILAIGSVINVDERNEALELMCTEKVN